jgi:hypothetical protein
MQRRAPKISRTPRTLTASGEKRKTTMERLKNQKKKEKGDGGKKGKKTERIKTALAEALRLSSAPPTTVSESGKRYKEKTCRGRMRGTTMAQAKASARSSRLRGRRRDEDDGDDDVRTFSSAFSRLPFLCDVGNLFLF